MKTTSFWVTVIVPQVMKPAQICFLVLEYWPVNSTRKFLLSTRSKQSWENYVTNLKTAWAFLYLMEITEETIITLVLGRNRLYKP